MKIVVISERKKLTHKNHVTMVSKKLVVKILVISGGKEVNAEKSANHDK